jgi:hypothetical protein
MNLNETLRLVSEKERTNGALLNVALSLKRYRDTAGVDILRGLGLLSSNCKYQSTIKMGAFVF